MCGMYAILELNELISEKEKKQLEKWTSLKCSEIVFDSNIDNWAEYASVLNERIIGKKQLVCLIEDDRREKFGYYLNNEIIEKYGFSFNKTDNKSFEFNLHSNGRLQHPTKFEIKDLEYGYGLIEKNQRELIQFGNILLYKKDFKCESCYFQHEERYNYHGANNILCEENEITGSFGEIIFTPKQFLIIQMK